LGRELEQQFDVRCVFIDIDNIPFGVNFHDHIGSRVGECDILIALIGQDWLDARDEAGNRRLDNPDDFVRVEIGSALKRGIRVIPVLLDNTPIPRPEQLPADIRELSMRNGVDVRRASFEGDSDRLLAGIGLDKPKPKKKGGGWKWAVAVLVLAMGAGGGLYASGFDPLTLLPESQEDPETEAEIEFEAPGRIILKTPTLGLSLTQDGEAVPMRQIDSDGITPGRSVAYLEKAPFTVNVSGAHWQDTQDTDPAVLVALSDQSGLFDYTEINETQFDDSIFHWACTVAVSEFGSGDFYTADMSAGFGSASVPCGNNYVGPNHFSDISNETRSFFVSEIKDEFEGPNLIFEADELSAVIYIEDQNVSRSGTSSVLMYNEIENLTLVFVDE